MCSFEFWRATESTERKYCAKFIWKLNFSEEKGRWKWRKRGNCVTSELFWKQKKIDFVLKIDTFSSLSSLSLSLLVRYHLEFRRSIYQGFSWISELLILLAKICFSFVDYIWNVWKLTNKQHKVLKSAKKPSVSIVNSGNNIEGIKDEKGQSIYYQQYISCFGYPSPRTQAWACVCVSKWSAQHTIPYIQWIGSFQRRRWRKKNTRTH